MSEAVPQVDTGRSFLRLVCPFRFHPGGLSAIIRRADQSVDGRPPLWGRITYQSLLPGTGRYVNSSVSDLSAACVWRLDRNSQRRAPGLAVGTTCYFRVKKRLYVVRIESAELALFGTGIGFLILEFVARAVPRGRDLAEIAAPPDSPATWIELAKILRRGELIHGPIIRTQFANVLGAEHEPDGTPSSTADYHRLRDYIATLISTVGLHVLSSPDEPIDIKDQDAILLSEQNLTFMSLFLTGASHEQMREWAARLRYSVGARAEYGPAPAELALDDLGIQRRSDRSFLYGSITAAGFIGSDLPKVGFWQQFPTELRREYQLALLVALQQRHALLALSSLVSDRWLNADNHDRVTQFGKIQDQLQYLSARLMPVQMLGRNSQQRFYATMRVALEVEHLYSNVRQTVSDLSESLRLRLSEDQSLQQLRFERRVSVLALVFGVPSLVLAFLAINVKEFPAQLPLAVALSVVALSFTLGLLVALTIRRRVT